MEFAAAHAAGSLAALRCGVAARRGYSHWVLRLLADENAGLVTALTAAGVTGRAAAAFKTACGWGDSWRSDLEAMLRHEPVMLALAAHAPEQLGEYGTAWRRVGGGAQGVEAAAGS